MTAAEVLARVEKIKAATSTRGSSLWRGLRFELFTDVLRAISNSTVDRSTTRALAEAALRVLE